MRGPVSGAEQRYALISDWLPSAAGRGRSDRCRPRPRAARNWRCATSAGHGPADARDLAQVGGADRCATRAPGWRRSAAGCASVTVDWSSSTTLRGSPSCADRPLLGAFEPVLMGWCSREPVLGEHDARVVTGGIFRAFAFGAGCRAPDRQAGGHLEVRPRRRGAVAVRSARRRPARRTHTRRPRTAAVPRPLSAVFAVRAAASLARVHQPPAAAPLARVHQPPAAAPLARARQPHAVPIPGAGAEPPLQPRSDPLRGCRVIRVGPSGGARAQALQANRQAGRHRRARPAEPRPHRHNRPAGGAGRRHGAGWSRCLTRGVRDRAHLPMFVATASQPTTGSKIASSVVGRAGISTLGLARHARSGSARSIRAAAAQPTVCTNNRDSLRRSRSNSQWFGTAPAVARYDPVANAPRAPRRAKSQLQVPNPSCKCQIPAPTQIWPAERAESMSHPEWRDSAIQFDPGTCNVAAFRRSISQKAPTVDHHSAETLNRADALNPVTPLHPT